MKRLICLLLSIFLLTACSPQTTESPADTDSDSKGGKDVVIETQVVEQTLDPNQSYLTGNYTKVDGKTIEQYPRLTNLPTLYITLDDGLYLSDIQHGVYSTATYTFVDQHLETSYYELPLSIKGRGNYSWTFAQKPYTLKLDAAADLMGMGAAKKWVLVTVSSDKSMLHNYLTQKMAAQMGLVGTVENEYVDLVVNGIYSGTYVLTESIQLHDSRINVPGNEGILFEIEMEYRHSDHSDCIVMYENRRDPSNSIHLTLKEYQGQEYDELDRATIDALKKEMTPFFGRVEQAMKSGSLRQLDAVVDIDSFVNWYLLNEFCYNYDSSFVSSCYCYINEAGKLYMGPCWDYDTCYGIQSGQTDGSYILQTAAWYQWLFDYSPDFVERVEERWTEMRQEGGLIDWFMESIDTTVEKIELSERIQHTVYPYSELTDLPYDMAVEFMKNWINDRLIWMDYEYLIG